nr:hypothetical protein [Tanacetum cinerariifolium]
VIVVPSILAEQFELKHSLINMMTLDQFFGLEKDNPHDHIRAAHRWLEKEPPRSILTWEDLVSKFINEFFPSSRTTDLRNEISNFQQRFNESFHEAWDRYKDLLRAYPHHGFTELQLLDTFYNALNLTDQDSLNSAAGEITKLTHAVNQQTSAVTTAMTAILKQFQATPPPASIKAVEEIYVTCGGAHPYYQCLAASGNTFAELEKVKRMNEANMEAMQTQINNVKKELRNEMKNSIQASMSNQTNELKNMMASFFQMNTASTSGSGSLPSNTIANPKGKLKAITTRSGIVLDGPFVPIPPPFINPKEDETIKVPPPLMFKQLHINITLADALILIPKYQKMLKALLSNKEKLQELANTPLNENYSSVILKKLPKKLRDPGKFLIPCGFSELKCKALADLAGIARDVFVPVGKFTFPADFVIVDYESDPRISLILDFLKKLSARNHQSGNPTFPSHPKLTSPEVKDDVFDPEGGNVIKSLNNNPTPDRVLKPLFPSPIPVEDGDSFLEKCDTSLSFLEDEIFIDHTKETNSGNTTTHADYSLPKYDSFLFEIKSDQGKLNSVFMNDNVPNVLTTHPTLMLDSEFIPSDNSLLEFKTFYFDIEEMNSGSTTIYADISLSDLESFNFDFKLIQVS